jgi:hypothetical protein
MRKKLLIAVLAALVVSVMPATAAVPAAQEESGIVVGPSPHPQDPNVCFQGVVRRMSMAAQGLYTGPAFGAIFDVDDSTWGGKFKLTRTDAAMGDEDIDIYFFKTFGEIADDPAMNSPTILMQYDERNTDGEAGIIPPETTKAIVCLWSGLEAGWEYEAAPPKKAKKKKK